MSIEEIEKAFYIEKHPYKEFNRLSRWLKQSRWHLVINEKDYVFYSLELMVGQESVYMMSCTLEGTDHSEVERRVHQDYVRNALSHMIHFSARKKNKD